MKLERSCANRATSVNVKFKSIEKPHALMRAFALALVLALTCLPLAGCSGNATGASGTASSSGSSQASSSQTAVQADSSSSASAESGQGEISVTVNVKGDFEGMIVEEASTLSIASGSTALDALLDTGLEVNVSDSSFGKYVDSIGGLAASGSNGWTYSVNDEMPTVSAADYELEDGDTVSWSYYVA